jgi:hypothetical protein
VFSSHATSDCQVPTAGPAEGEAKSAGTNPKDSATCVGISTCVSAGCSYIGVSAPEATSKIKITKRTRYVTENERPKY